MQTKLFFVWAEKDDDAKRTGIFRVNGNKVVSAPPSCHGWVGRAWTSFLAANPDVTVEEGLPDRGAR